MCICISTKKSPVAGPGREFSLPYISPASCCLLRHKGHHSGLRGKCHRVLILCSVSHAFIKEDSSFKSKRRDILAFLQSPPLSKPQLIVTYTKQVILITNSSQTFTARLLYPSPPYLLTQTSQCLLKGSSHVGLLLFLKDYINPMCSRHRHILIGTFEHFYYLYLKMIKFC